ncbi:MAG: O-antigen ligase family protein [Pseudomonadota bacterium]
MSLVLPASRRIAPRQNLTTVDRPEALPQVVRLYLILVIVPIGVQVGPLLLTGLRICLLCLILPLLFRLFSKEFGRVLPTDVLFLLHLSWATVALVMNNPDAVVQQVGSTGIEFLGGYALGRAYIRSKAAFIALAKTMVALVLMMIPFAVFETTTGRSLWIEALQAVPGVRTVTDARSTSRTLFGMTLERVQMGFAHPIHFGLFCAIAFSPCVVALTDQFSRVRRWIAGSLLAGSACLALSAGALIAIALQIGLITWALIFAKAQHRWWILIGVMVSGYVAVDLLSNRTPIQVFMSYATFSPQTAYWRATTFEWGMASVWKHPVFGTGLNDWVRPEFMKSDSVDNFWLLMAMRYGIPGFVSLLVGYLWLLWRVIRRDLSGDAELNRLRYAWVYTCLGMSFTLCTVHVWTAIFSFTFFMLGAGAWIVSADISTLEDITASPDKIPDRRATQPLANWRQPSETRGSNQIRYTRFADVSEREHAHNRARATNAGRGYRDLCRRRRDRDLS